MGFLDAFVGGVVIALIALYVKNRYQEVEYVESSVDGHKYLVRKAEDSQDAANTLANINKQVERLIDHLMATAPSDERTLLMRERYDRNSLSEGGHNSGYTSFSVNKGEKIVMCIRSRDGTEDNGDIERFNTLMYVILHEIAHLVTAEIGHTKLFWDNFRWILDEADKIGVYRKVDYSKEPEEYCGIHINSSASHQKK
eukprot:jgi/Tetstr1/447245/TSEL_034682.t1